MTLLFFTVRERTVSTRSAFAMFQPLVAVTLLTLSVFGNVGHFADAARGLVTKLAPTLRLQKPADEGDQVAIIPVIVADRQALVVRHMLVEI